MSSSSSSSSSDESFSSDSELEKESKADAELPFGPANRPDQGAVVYEVKKAPRLATQGLEAVLKFEKRWLRYERSLNNRRTQGWRQEAPPLRDCIEAKVLKSICKYELDLPRNGWKNVSDESLKQHLFGRSDRFTEREILYRSSLIEESLQMVINDDTSLVDSTHKLFEDLEELLEMGMNPS